MLNNDYRLRQEAFELARHYTNCYKKNWKIKLPRLNNIKVSKFWKYFLATAENYSNEVEWDARMYAKFVCNNFPNEYPHFLRRKATWQAYKDEYLPETTEQEERILLDMLATHKAVKQWMKKNKKTYQDFVNERWIQIKRGMYSFFYLSILSPFIDKYEQEDNKPIPESELKTKRMLIMSHKKVKETLQRELGEYFKEKF